MSYDEKLLKMRRDCHNYFDDNLGKLEKKMKELSNLFDVAFELMKATCSHVKEFDKTRKNVEAIADGYCKIGTKIVGVSHDVDKLRKNQEESNTKISDISEDLAEYVSFVDNVAHQFNLHDNGSLPKIRGKRKIKINIKR